MQCVASFVSKCRVVNYELVVDITYIEAHSSSRILFNCIFTSIFRYVKCVC